jgi:membrane protein YqaA with SNARE-associated domain
MTLACTFFPLPTPQLIMDFGGRFDPILVAIVGAIGTCIAGLIDYTVITYVLKFLSSSFSSAPSTPDSVVDITNGCSHNQTWRNKIRRYLFEVGSKYYEKIASLRQTRTYKYCTWLYNRVTFISLVIAGFTPIPFEPFRFLAAATKYSRGRYALAIFIGRAPRYYILGKFQRMLHIPRSILIGSIFLILIIALVRMLWKRKYQKNPNI